MVKFCPTFCYCAVDQEKVVFKRKWAVSGPSAHLGPEMVKFCPNFCYCAADQEKVVFKRKRAVSSPPALFGPAGSLEASKRFQNPRRRLEDSGGSWKPLEAPASAPGGP